MKQTLLTVLLAVTALLAAAQDNPTTVTFADKADIGLRTDKSCQGDASTFEYRTESNRAFYGLMSFDFELPQGKKVESAMLYFVTERRKGGNENDLKVYAYQYDVTETMAYSSVSQNVTNALANEPIATQTLSGQNGVAIFNDLKDDYKHLEQWTNKVDVTSYVKKLNLNDNHVNFLIAQDYSGDNRIYTKEVITVANLPQFVLEDTNNDLNKLKPYLEVVFVDDLDNNTVSVGPIADTWVRSNASSNTYGGEDQMQIANWADGKFCGLMEFALPEDIFDTEKYEVSNATLRLFHKMNQGGKELALYPYEPGFDENSKFETVGDDVNTAIGTTPIITYTANGQNGKACWDSGLNEEYRNTEAWTNNLNITAYVKSLVESAKTRAATPINLAFVVAKTGVDELGNNGSVKTVRISTKEATDINNTNYGITFAQKDIQPLLTVSYAKKNNPTGIQTVEVEMENAPVEYYNLNGVKVSGDNMAPGIYVRRQGTKTTKILVK